MKRIWRVAERRILLKNFISVYTFRTMHKLLEDAFIKNASTDNLALFFIKRDVYDVIWSLLKYLSLLFRNMFLLKPVSIFKADECV